MKGYYVLFFIIVLCYCVYLFYSHKEINKFETAIYSVVCVENVTYLIFDSGAATVKRDVNGEPELCDLDE